MTTPGDDLRERGAYGAPHAKQVNLDHPLELPLLDGGDGHRRVDGDAGVGDHHVQTPEPLGGGHDHRVEPLAVGDIEGHRQCAVAAELEGERVEHLLAPAGQYDVGATGVERPGSGHTRCRSSRR